MARDAATTTGLMRLAVNTIITDAGTAFMLGVALALHHPEYASALYHGLPEEDRLDRLAAALDGIVRQMPIESETPV